MNPTQKAIWLIETRLAMPFTLDEIATHAGVSPFHLTRSFTAIHGRSLMRYARARRLSEAARRLVRGEAGDILGIALDAGYGSHEAFTRAYRDHFGETPEETRSRGTLGPLKPTEAIIMDATPDAKLATPRIVEAGERHYAGIAARHDVADPSGITQQWQRLGPYMAGFPGRVGDGAFGISYDMDDEGRFTYLCGFEIKGGTVLDEGITALRLPPQRYAVFEQPDHVSAIRQVIATIFARWLPTSGHRLAESPMIERYGPHFDPISGSGGFEIWVPIA